MATITLIPGDGIGPEITEAVVKILDAAGADLQYDEQQAGLTALREEGDLIPESLLDSIKTHKVALKGPLTTPVGEGFRSINVTLRQKFDLYQNVRPCRTIDGIKTRFDQVDFVLFRENTEGLYSGFEIFDERNQIADGIARVSRKGSERIIRAAFEYARKHGRKTVTLVHKANIIKQASGLFLTVGRELALEYPDIEFQDRIVDNMCMQMVMYPDRYDVIVATNLFGDILSDLGAGLVGGLGVVPGANIGDGIAIFEAVHGSAPDIAGQGIANPTALLQSAIMMLRHLNQMETADKVETALFKTLADQSKTTGDLGGNNSTQQFADNVIANL
ncbi:isocitrate/isopropylmalate family dehydrogenase [Pontibacter sp. G13]|uniref:isocitrate/isopropylmalate dehydrogenase family protein n=1 Tax=Pontibacter sp. G13 TaxID=3074898 RepID=UPI00288A9436|nr:isocitrate/isopropylmalate family dehydrogenase [Pontibacter sp. G13]WNJ18037.1 isocitrate/isopropylmalate family dehydrogenase [Pontibacter sp. G13]